MPLPDFVTLFPVLTPTLLPAVATNLYLIAGGRRAVLVDAGFSDPPSLAPVVEAVRNRNLDITGILLTHYHPDHAAGAGYLSNLWNCPVYVHPAEAEHLRETIPASVLRPELVEGQVLAVGDLAVTVVETPGHTRGHVSFWIPDAGVLFCGDVVLGAGTTWIGPPDGHLRTYLDTLRRLRDMSLNTLAPGHGPIVDHPGERILYYIEHRLERENQILELLRTGPKRVRELLRAIYDGQVPPSARWVAERTILGHLIKLEEEGRIRRIAGEGPQKSLADAGRSGRELEDWVHTVSFGLS